MGAYRELELTLLSARDLKNVNLITRMDVYAVASISGDPMTRQCTPPDPSGGRNPSWNSTLRFSVPASASAAGGGWLHVLLRSERALGDRDIGEVVVPLAELLAGADGPAQQPPRLASYQVHTVHRGEPRGVLNVSYRLGHVVAPVKHKGAEGDKSPVIAYPVPPQQQQPFQPQNGSYYPPQQPLQRQNGFYYPAAPQQQPFQPQNPQQQPFQPQNPQQQPFQPQNPQQPYHRPRDAYAPRHEEEDLSPRKTTDNGHGPTQVYNQIILNPPPPPRSNTIPAKPDGPKPKPSYVPPQQSNAASLGKTDYSRPKSYTQSDTQVNWPKDSTPKLAQEKTDYSRPKPFPHHSGGPKAPQQDTQAGPYSPNRPNMSPKKPDPSRHEALLPQQVREHAYTQSNIHTGKADSWPKEAYAPTRANSTPGKTDQSGPKAAALQHDRMPTMPTATAR